MLTQSQFNHLYSLYKKGKANEQQIDLLSPYKVQNAIIMAAGTSSRFVPLSLEKPKGLLKVRGEVLIERQIQQLKKSNINDITLVVGYLKEQFFYLKEKYNINIVINQDYSKYNNTSSLIRVVDKLSNTYICSSDNYFVKNVFEEYVYRSFYSTIFSFGKTDEWCVKTDKSDRIINVKIGGKKSWFMLGHVYFDSAFSTLFSKILQSEYINQFTKENLWETLYIAHINELSLYAKHYKKSKLLEFDSLDELRKFDKSYINNCDCKILKDICLKLDCKIKDIKNIKVIKTSPIKNDFSFKVKCKEYIYSKI